MKVKILLLLVITMFISVVATLALTQHEQSHGSVAAKSTAKQPLYWVAPMDSNYRRSEPGLSPMGMELVPVYEAQATPGIVTISAAVIQNMGVRLAKAEFKSLNPVINTVGYVQYDEDKITHIHPRVEGWIEQLFIKAQGAKVSAGEPLYTLYSPQLVNAQEEFLLAVNRNNPVLLKAAKARLTSLHMSPTFITRLQQSKQVVQNVTFYARKSGVVEQLNVREGFYVKPGMTMMSIAQLDEVWVEAEVFERQAAQLDVGLRVTMAVNYSKTKQWHGVVDYIYPSLNAENRTVRVRLRFSNPARQLKPNMFVQVAIYPKPSEAHWVIPKQALIRSANQDRVVVALGAGQFKSVAVKVGQISDTEVAILSGLQADDEVVISAQFLIDSESAKDSDFLRMQELSHPTTMTHDMPEQQQSATVSGVINAIDSSQRVINISRDAIAKWGRGPATMDFTLAPELNIESLAINSEIKFTFVIDNGDFIITALDETRPEATNMQHHMH